MQRHSDSVETIGTLRSWFSRTVLVALGCVTAAAAEVSPAEAAAPVRSPGCTLFENGDLDFLTIVGGPFSAARTYTLKSGETVIIRFENIATLEVKFDGVTVFSAPPPATGTLAYEVPASGTVTIDKTVEAQPAKTGSVEFGCNPVPPDLTGDPLDPRTEADFLNARRMTGIGILHANLFLPADSLPDLPNATPLDLAFQQCEEELRAAQQAVRDVQPSFDDPPESLGEADLRALQLKRAIDARNAAIEKCEQLRVQIDGQRSNFSATDSTVSSHVPWPVEAAAFGPDYKPTQNLSASGDHRITLGGLPVKAWFQIKGTILDGDFDRRGGSGQAVFGVVAPVTESLDVGVFGHILAGEVDSAVLDTELDTVIGGVGAYAKLKLPRGFRLGASVSHGWGSNDIVIAGGAGSFPSSHFMFDASLARPFEFGNFIVTPMALITYTRMSLGAYRDSNGVAIPRASDSTFALSGAVAFAYPIQVNGRIVAAMVPRFSLRSNFYAKRAETLVLGPALTLEGDSFTVDISGGVGLQLAGGGVIDLSLGASGVGGSARGVSLRGMLTLPLN